jgi:DNA repair exonuclease SbcCD nuclease subunit
MKFLYTSDWHLRESTPINRVEEDFLTLQLSKIKQVLKIAKDEKVDGIIHGGDVFDNWKVSNKVLGETIEVLKEFKDNFILQGIIGNHDIPGYNLNSLYDSSLGVLVKNEQYINIQLDLKAINTRPHAMIDIEKDYFSKNDMIISHDMITPEEAPFDHIHYKLLDGCTSIMLCSHYHKPFIIYGKKTVFLNPGALTRLTIDDNDYIPGVIIFEMMGDLFKNARRVELNVGTFKEVFKEVKKIGDKIDIPKFDIERASGQNIIEKIMHSGKMFNEEQYVIDESVLRVQNAEKRISEEVI